MILFALLVCLLSCLAVAAPQSPALPNVNRLERLREKFTSGNFPVPQELSLKFARQLSRLWDFTKPDKYQYKFSQRSQLVNAIGPWLITVDNGVSTVVRAQDQVPPDFDTSFDLRLSANIAEAYGTVDKLYDRVISNLKDGFVSAPFKVDLQNFVITDVFIDISRQIADEEFGFQVSDYTKL